MTIESQSAPATLESAGGRGALGVYEGDGSERWYRADRQGGVFH